MIELKDKLQTNRTIEDLISKKTEIISSEYYQEWFQRAKEAKRNYKDILSEEQFKESQDLSKNEFDKMFKLMKTLSANRSLRSLLYEENGIDVFNKTLWGLYYGNDFLPNRIEEFLNLRNIGQQSLSQFLVMFNDKKFPFVTDQNLNVLNIDTELEETAKKEAIKRFEIAEPSKFSSRTLLYLAHWVIFEKIKDILDLENFDNLNKLLWYYGERLNPEEEEESYVTLGLEKDLRKFLAEHPQAIEAGLTLVENGEEYNTHEVGRIDLLLRDKSNNYVVVELKRRRTGDQAVGQILRYIGWVEENLSKNVRGIIIIGEPYDKLDYAVKPVNDLIQIKYYRVKFEIDEFRN